MTTKDPLERLSDFNLHGNLVFDDYLPISCCPSKGVLGRLALLSIFDPLWEPSMTSFWLQNSQAIFQAAEGPTIAVIELRISKDLIDVLASAKPQIDVAKKIVDLQSVKAFAVKLATSIANERKFKLPPQEENDTVSNEPQAKSSKGIKAGFKYLKKLGLGKQSTRSPEEEDDEGCLTPDPQSDYIGEVGHIAEFIANVEVTADPPVHDDTISHWLEGLCNLLHALENLPNYCAAVLIMRKPEDKPVDLPSHLPKKMRENLIFPAIIMSINDNEFDKFLAPALQGGIQWTSITPIPLNIGDHIYREIQTKGALSLVKHHGIYMGNGRVMHFAGTAWDFKGLTKSRGEAKIRSVSLVKFMKNGSRLKVQKYTHSDPIIDTLERAETALVEQSFPEYNLLKNNCEHFCQFCKTGVKRSKQVEKGTKYSIAAGVAITAAVVGLVLTSMKQR